MRNLAMAAGMIASLMALGSCEETTMTGGAATPVAYAPASGDAVARLRSLGFAPAAKAASGEVVAMQYSGPVTAAVVCKQGSGGFGPISRGSATLDAYVILSGGRATSGIFAMTQRNASGQVEGIDFNFGESKAFSSGLACKAA